MASNLPRLGLVTLLSVGPVAVLGGASIEAQTPQTSLGDLTDAYVERWRATLREDSDVADLDRLLELYDDDIVYEHPRVGARITGRTVLREGMSRFLGQTRRPTVEVRQRIVGRGIVVLELRVTFEVVESGETAERDQVTLLEFGDGKITRIVDYW